MDLYRHRSACSLATVVMVIVTLAGCSGGIKKVTVKGTIAYKGQPLRYGMLQFIGPEGSTSAAVIQGDGTFIITDVVPGEVKVGVMQGPQSSGTSSGEKTAPQPAPVSLPTKYGNPETSGVKYTITPETKEIHIELK
jgi:hypothetical protein